MGAGEAKHSRFEADTNILEPQGAVPLSPKPSTEGLGLSPGA